MSWSQILDALGGCPIVPVLTIETLADAAPLAAALAAGGITVAEVTLRTTDGLASVRAFKETQPQMITGAGTILSTSDLDDAVSAGADFIVSPGFDADLLKSLSASETPVMPGVATPGEAMAARAAGINRVKLFPAEIVGGAPMIKALAGPLQDMSFMPTGGVTLTNLGDYLALDNVYAAGGTWIATAAHIREGDWSGIEARAREAVEAARLVRI